MKHWTDQYREPTIQQYLLNRIRIDKNGCWIFGNKSPDAKNPYPEACYDGVERRTSIVSYEAFKGPIPKGKIVRHTCDNPPCINPEHLILGTKKDNRGDFMKRHPKARELCLEAAKIGAKGVKRFWDNMTPEERERFIKERAAKQKAKRNGSVNL